MEDVKTILSAFLLAQETLTDVVGNNIFCPRLPHNEDIPAVVFKRRGGQSNPHVPPIVDPSFQFICYGGTPEEAESVNIALYDVLQGIQEQSVTIGANTYMIKSAIEEGQGGDFEDTDIPRYFGVVVFYRIKIQT